MNIRNNHNNKVEEKSQPKPNVEEIKKTKKERPLIETQFLNPKVITNIKQSANKRKKSAFIDADICKGYDENHELNSEEFRGLIADLNQYFPNNFRVVIYRNPHAKTQNSQWAKDNEGLIEKLKQNNQFYYCEDYQELSERKEMESSWTQLWNDEDHKAKKEFLVEAAVGSFQSRGKNKELFDIDYSKQVVIAETINVVSAIPKKDSNDNKLHVILSGEKLYSINEL